MAVSSVCTGVLAIFVAFVLGLMAQLASFTWPIYCLVGLTLIAGVGRTVAA